MPTSQDLWLALNGGDPRRGVAALAAEAARWKQASHCCQAFPQAKARGGFAVLLGNTPWERIMLQAEELLPANVGDVNTYALFAETFARLV